MIKHICDICKREEARLSYKVRKREFHRFWGEWKEAEVCGECARKLLSVKAKEAED